MDIPAGTLITLFGGVVIQARTQKEVYEHFTRTHSKQHETVGEEKFQYSVMVGSEQLGGSLAWLVPTNDFGLLYRLLDKSSKCAHGGCKTSPNYNYENETKGLYCAAHKQEGMADVKNAKCTHKGCTTPPNYNFENETKRLYCSAHKKEGMVDMQKCTRRTMKAERELKGLTVEGRASTGLGQYAQHTCCGAHANAHLFPIFIFREGEEGRRGRQGGDEDWMQLKGVALRANRLIKKGEEVSIKYVGSGRAGHFQKVFDCACCWCTGRCNRGAHRTEQAWINAINQIEEKQPAKALKDLERQIMADKANLQGLRRAHPGTLARTRPGGKIATQVATSW
jgi:Rieske Fe-S protein